MARVRADGLLDDLDAISEQMSRALGVRAASNGGSRGWVPPVDIWGGEDELVVENDAPGWEPPGLAAEGGGNQLGGGGGGGPNGTPARRHRSQRLDGRLLRTLLL